MRKTWKGAVVERIEHPVTKRVGVVRLDKSRMLFWARENDESDEKPFSDSDGGKVRDWLRLQLARAIPGTDLDWMPVIEVHCDGKRRMRYRNETQVFGEAISLAIDRYYLALTRDRRAWRKLSWEEYSLIAPEMRYATSSQYAEGPKAPETGFTSRRVFSIPSVTSGYDTKTLVLHYTEELWEGLLLITRQIAAARAQLDTALGSPAGLQTLVQLAAAQPRALLTAGS